MSSAGKKRKSYYLKAAQGKRGRHDFKLCEGMKGFLITCNNQEKQAVREAYNIFNKYADIMYGSEQTGDGDSDSGDEDIDEALSKEVTALQNSAKNQKQFQVVESGATNCVFIKTTLQSPELLLHKIFSDLHESGRSQSRFMLRVSPVMATCRADESKLEALAHNLLGEYFKVCEPRTYSIVYKVRNNNSVGRNMIYSVLGRVISDLSPLSKVNLDNPDLVINVDVIRTVCCVGVVSDFYKFRKYNMQEVVKKENKGAVVNESENSVQVPTTKEGDAALEDGMPSDNASSTMPASDDVDAGCIATTCDKSTDELKSEGNAIGKEDT